MIDEEPLTAGTLRRLGFPVPWSISDDVRCQLSRRLDAGSAVLQQTVEAFPVGYIESIDVKVRVS